MPLSCPSLIAVTYNTFVSSYFADALLPSLLSRETFPPQINDFGSRIFSARAAALLYTGPAQASRPSLQRRELLRLHVSATDQTCLTTRALMRHAEMCSPNEASCFSAPQERHGRTCSSSGSGKDPRGHRRYDNTKYRNCTIAHSSYYALATGGTEHHQDLLSLC